MDHHWADVGEYCARPRRKLAHDPHRHPSGLRVGYRHLDCHLNTFTGMGVNFAIIVFLQHMLEYSPLQVGFPLLPATLGRVAGELAAGHLAARWGARGPSLAGLLSFAIACAAVGRADQQSRMRLIGVLLIVGNLGMALSNSPMIYAGLRTLRDERSVWAVGAEPGADHRQHLRRGGCRPPGSSPSAGVASTRRRLDGREDAGSFPSSRVPYLFLRDGAS